MSKRKFKKGAIVTSLDDFMKHPYFIVNGKTFCAGWCRGWQLNMANAYIKHGVAFIAERLTNEEFYAGKTDEQLCDIIGDERLCNFCPIPDEFKGIHCYGGHPVMCDGSYCDDALKCWKEEYVE